VVLKVSMDGQKSFFCIMAGQEPRTKAMKIAVSVPGNNIYIYIYISTCCVCIYTYIVFIKEIEMIKIIYIYIYIYIIPIHLQGWKQQV